MVEMTRMSKARAKMLIKHPFFATLLVSTPWEMTEAVETAATDMEKLYFNPNFMEKLTDDEILFVLAHEVMHMALEHGLRKQARNHMLWNIAADYCLNLVLKDSGFDIWKEALCDDVYKGMSADQVYDKLQQQCQKKGGGQGQGKPGFGDPGGQHHSPMLGDIKEPEGAGDPAHEAKVKRGIQQKVAAAANVARMAGKFGGELERLVGEILDPKVPWSHVLRDFMTRVTKDDEQWSRRNRRFQSVYLPARHSEKMGEIVLIGDTSGSIGNDELCKYMAEAGAIAEDVHPERIRILWADTRVAGEQVFEEGMPIDPKPKGGGGTDMRVAISAAEKYSPEVVVLFTDCYTPWPEVEPDFPLIVCSTTDQESPVGLNIRI
jgi:predicted metal-dependent peptidase